VSKYHFFLVLGFGLAATSFASIFIKLTPTTPLIIAFWRMFLATIGTIVLAIITKQFYQLKQVNLTQFRLMFFSGFFLALHFATWILSLFYTTIAESLVLVDSSPIIVLLIGIAFLNERINRSQMLGVGLSLSGVLIIAIGSPGPNVNAPDPLFGNFLASLGAITVSGYIIIGRIIRKNHNLGIFVYTSYVYGISTVFLFLIALIVDTEELLNSFLIQIPVESYFYFFLLAFVSTLLGHSLYNYALKEIKAALVSIVTLGEPLISSILAILILQQYPSTLTVLGGSIVIFGVILTIIKEEKPLNSELSKSNKSEYVF